MHVRDTVSAQLLALGVAPSSVLVVHTAFSHVGPLAGGPHALIDVLLEVLGPDGTLVMPSMSDDDDHVFDVSATPCRGMGIVAETFWRRPGVARSESPHAFAALGRHAALITAPHPPHVPHGLESPIGRAYELDASVLLLGVGHDANTSIHLAENMARVRYRRAKHLMISDDGVPKRLDYAEIDHCCERFALLDGWLDEAGLQGRGRVGQGEARLMRARAVVDVALRHLRDDEFVFLHAPGRCGECDDARAAVSTDAGRPSRE